MLDRNSEKDEHPKSEEAEINSLAFLPEEMLVYILQFVKGDIPVSGTNFQELTRIRRTDKRFNSLIDEVAKGLCYVPNPISGIPFNDSYATKQVVEKSIPVLMRKFSSQPWGPRFYKTIEEAKAAPDFHHRLPEDREILIFKNFELLGYIDRAGKEILFQGPEAEAQPEQSQPESGIQETQTPSSFFHLKNDSSTSLSNDSTDHGDNRPTVPEEEEVPLIRKKK